MFIRQRPQPWRMHTRRSPNFLAVVLFIAKPAIPRHLIQQRSPPSLGILVFLLSVSFACYCQHQGGKEGGAKPYDRK